MSKNLILVISCVSFLAMGWLIGALGPALENLSDQTGSDLATIGALFTVTFLGGLVAQVLTGPINDRFGQRTVLLLGAALLGPSAVGVALSHNLWLTLFLGALWGLGFGALDVGHNVLIAEVFNGRNGIMNLLHAFFGIGASVGPAVAGVMLNWQGTAIPAIWIGGGLTLLTLPFVYRLPHGLVRREDGTSDAAKVQASAFSYRVPLLWLLSAVMMIYVGIEVGLGGWMPDYLDQTTGLNKDATAFATAGFWFALTGGRALIAVAGSRFTPLQVLWISILGSALGGLILMIGTGSATLSIAGMLLSGLCYGPIYPTIMIVVTGTFRSGPGKAASVAAAMGSLGGGALPWMQGILLDKVSATSSVIFVGTGALIMLTLWMLAIQRLPRHGVASQVDVIPAR